VANVSDLGQLLLAALTPVAQLRDQTPDEDEKVVQQAWFSVETLEELSFSS
jgi:hypothetical protein